MRYGSQLLVAGTSLLAAACTSTSGLPPAPEVAVPIRGDYRLTPYYIQIGDILDVRLMLNPELNEEIAVRPDGHISTTVARDELAVGRTVGELTESLTRVYSRDLKQPRLSVIVKTFAPTRVYVGGEVTAPGEYASIGPPLSLSQVISRAGGLKLTGDDRNMFIIRRSASGAPQLFSVRYSDVTHARDASADVTLAPFDVVYVPKTGIAEVYAYYNQYIQQFANPSFGFNYILNPGAGASNVISTPATTTPATVTTPTR